MAKKSKRKDSQKYGGTEREKDFLLFFFSLSVFVFVFVL